MKKKTGSVASCGAVLYLGFRRSLTLGLTLVAAMLMMLVSSFRVSASVFPDETLHYTVSYKWGIIHKDAADATLTLRRKGDLYNIRLTAKTQPWADRIFSVRDTLLSEVATQGFKPRTYTKISHEGGRYERDRIRYSYAGSVVKGSADRVVVRKDGSRSTDTRALTSTGTAFDMLSVFYYIRLLDFDNMKSGTLYKTTVFSGSKAETLTIKMLGKEKLKLRDKSTREAYKLSFTFTSGGKKKSSDDIFAWISTDSNHIPLYLTGKLPVGEVRVYYRP